MDASDIDVSIIQPGQWLIFDAWSSFQDLVTCSTSRFFFSAQTQQRSSDGARTQQTATPHPRHHNRRCGCQWTSSQERVIDQQNLEQDDTFVLTFTRYQCVKRHGKKDCTTSRHAEQGQAHFVARLFPARQPATPTRKQGTRLLQTRGISSCVCEVFRNPGR